MEVAQKIGAVQVDVFEAARAGLIVAGYEINHLHVHVWPSTSMADFDFGSADHHPDPAQLDVNADRLREGLRKAGHGAHVPEA
jgi:diadenosine tetraphosphate (Ap4A) HIT family hydrolase